MSRRDAWDAQYNRNHWTNQQGMPGNPQQNQIPPMNNMPQQNQIPPMNNMPQQSQVPPMNNIPQQNAPSGQMKQGNPYQNGVYQGPQGIFSGVPTQNIERPAQEVTFTPYTQPPQSVVSESAPQQESVNEIVSVENEIDEQQNQEITEDVKELNTEVSEVETEEKAEPVAEEVQDAESTEIDEEQDVER
ncbi:MAG: hypothetical protein IKL06_07115 [Lachnospiraceae bacterium]|nr:hypothetical protein [Lachnospiraceae bacterium]